MRIQRVQTAFVLAAASLAPSLPHPSFAQTSVSASLYGAFNGTTNGNGTEQSPANQAGGLLEIRHISNPILGFEATYSFNRADQTYNTTIYPPVSNSCPSPCGPYLESLRVPANAHEVTADYVPSVHIANFRPFGVLGVGLLFNVPSGNQTLTQTNGAGVQISSSPSTGASTATKPVYVYGAGLDWGILPHIGLRFQYRGNLFQAPNLTKTYSSTNAFTHTAEPMIGVYFHF